MDAVRFLKEKDRMCEYYEYCEGCPLADGIETPLYCTCPEEEPEKTVAIIEKWSNTHPIQTNVDYVTEKLHCRYRGTKGKMSTTRKWMVH